MANSFYTHGGYPATRSQGASSNARAEFSLIEQGFDAVEQALDDKLDSSDLGAHTGASSNVHAATAISFSPVGNVAATNVQAAIAELDNEKATTGSVTSHTGASSGAHAASAISVTPTGNLGSNNVQAALQELQGDIDTLTGGSSLNDHINDTSGAHAASAISFSPAGNLSSDNVQAAIQELDSEKAALNGSASQAFAVANEVYGSSWEGKNEAPTKAALRTEIEAIKAAGAGILPGFMIEYGGDTAPTGYLLCNGANVSRATYAALFAVIGTKYGPGDGSTTFSLPDFRRRVAVGAGGAGSSILGSNVGDSGGSENHQLIPDEMPSHSHTLGLQVGARNGQAASGTPNFVRNQNTGLTGGDQPHNNMQPSLVVTKIIKT